MVDTLVHFCTLYIICVHIVVCKHAQSAFATPPIKNAMDAWYSKKL